MNFLHMDMEDALSGVLSSMTEDALFEHLKKALGITLDIKKNIQSIEKLERLRSIYFDPMASVLDLYAAQVERTDSMPEAHDEFMEDPEVKEIVKQKEQKITPELIKREISDLGESVCKEQLDVLLPLLSTALFNADEESKKLHAIRIERRDYNTLLFNKIEQDQRYKDILLLVSKNREKQAALRSENLHTTPSAFDDAMGLLHGEYADLYKKITMFRENFRAQTEGEANKKFWERIREAEDTYAKAKQEQEEQEASFFASVTEKVLSLSDITQEQADAWAEKNIFIAENGAAKLKRIGYAPEQMKKDLAEFYRYIGGKIGPISFVLEGRSQRAFARGRSTIALQGDFSKEDLFHECSHLTEHWDSAFGTACIDFIKKRAKGEPVGLKKLTGQAYRSNERAYPDHFIHPYVGKIYPDASTEVLSMGLQNFSSPQALANFALKDPEHFKLILGVCKRQNPFLQEKLEQATEKVKAAAQVQARKNTWEKALAKVSGTDFGKRLDSTTGGYMGYWIDRRGRSCSLYNDTEGETSVFSGILIFSGRLPHIRALAYLLIGHKTGKIYTEIPLEDGMFQITALFRRGIVPEWFDPEIPLPKV